MKPAFLSLALLFMLVGSTWAEELMRLNLDDVSAIGTSIRTDGQVKVEGGASIRITTRGPATICLAEVTAPDIEGAKLVYQASVRSDLTGAAYLEMWAFVGGGQYFSRGMNDAVQARSDWKVIRTPFLFQKGQRPDKLTLNVVINGKGTVWIDDIVLSREPLH